MESQFPVDPVQCSGLTYVRANRIAVGDDFLLHPWPPRKAECVEIEVRAEVWVSEEIPGASYASARFKNDVAG